MMRLLQRLGFDLVPDAHQWTSKWSTWLSFLQMGFAGALLVWFMLGDKIQDSMPTWVPIAIGAGMLICGFLQPAAVNTVQKKLQGDPPK